MAIYHCSVKVIGRNEGRSAIAAAAYRSGTMLTSIYDGLTRDYRKKGWIEESEIIIPKNAPVEYMDRSKLWNAVESVEKTVNAQLAREVEVALPLGMTREEQKEVLHRFVNENFVSKGMCADVAIHNPPVRNDKNQPITIDGTVTKDKSKMQFINPHAHILLTVRPIDENGKWEDKSKVEYLCVKDGIEKALTADEYKKASQEGWEKQFKYIDGKKKIWLPASVGEARKLKRVNRTPKTSKFGRKNPRVEYWNSPDRVLEWRKSWEECVNDQFEKMNVDTRIDCRSYEDQGLEILPTIHMGPAATNMERRADRLIREGKNEDEVVRSDIGDINREIKEHNKFVIGAKKWIEDELNKLKEALNIQEPKGDVIDLVKWCDDNGYILRPTKSKYAKGFSEYACRDMQEGYVVKEFVIKNRIYTSAQMHAFENKIKKKLSENEAEELTLSQRVNQLKDVTSAYSKLQSVKGTYDEREGKGILGRAIYTKMHKEDIDEYNKLLAEIEKKLNGEKIAPGKWKKEMKTLDKKIEDQKMSLVFVDIIENTIKDGPVEFFFQQIKKSKEEVKEAEVARQKELEEQEEDLSAKKKKDQNLS